jgi:AraC-like DNA-binding protein
LILEAKTLLKSTNLSIKEISNELNFGETSIFCRYFKRITGVSPKSYRHQNAITTLP